MLRGIRDLTDSINEFDGEETFGVGWWICLHHLINQLCYQATDGKEEIDLLFEDIRNRLYSLAVGVDVPRADAWIDDSQGTRITPASASSVPRRTRSP